MVTETYVEFLVFSGTPVENRVAVACTGKNVPGQWEKTEHLYLKTANLCLPDKGKI